MKPTEQFNKHENHLTIVQNSRVCVCSPYPLSVMITVLVVIVGLGAERHSRVAGRVSIDHYEAYLNLMHF